MSLYGHNEPLAIMSCGCKVQKELVIAAIQNTTISNNHYTIKCPMQNCSKNWQLKECANVAEWSIEQYNYYTQELKQCILQQNIKQKCPDCGVLCVKRGKSSNNNTYYVRCGKCWSEWCWLCRQKWRLYDENCSNTLCESNSTKEQILYNDDIKMHDKEKDDTTDGNGDDNESDDNESPQNESPADNISEDDYSYISSRRNNTNNKKKKKKNRDQKNKKKNKNDDEKKRKKEQVKMENGLVGLHNLGNTCYMNSALQCLLQCPGFVEAFFYDKIRLPTTKNGWRRTVTDCSSLSYIWSQFIKEIYTKQCGTTPPRDIKNALNRLNPVIGRGTQEDAFLVIETLLQGLDDELCMNESMYHEIGVFKNKDIPSHQNIQEILRNLWSSYTNGSRDGSTIVRELFDGIECEISTCPDCGYQSREFRQFRQIQLPLCNKNIKVNIKIYIPALTEFEVIEEINDTIAYDNTSYGLRYMVLSKISDHLVQNKINKENVNIRFGYIHPTNSKQGNDINQWIRFIDDNDNCAKIPNHSEIFAFVTSENDRFKFIPTYNLIVTEKDEWVSDIINTLTFTKIESHYAYVSGKDLIHKMNEIYHQDLEEYKSPIIYYNNHLITDDANRNIEITKRSCLLRIWIHPQFQKQSPSNVKIVINEKESKLIQHAINTSYEPSSLEDLVSILWNFATEKLKYFSLSALVPMCKCDYNDNQMKQNIQNEKSSVKLLHDKFKQLSDSEKLANKWLKIKIEDIKEDYKKQGINYTKPKMLDNIDECLKVYEMKETSDGNGIDCQRCPECPEIASREVNIIKTPQILLLHIDREGDDSGDNNKYTSRKRDNLIKYPLEGLTFLTDIYDLFGVVEHYGYGTDYGHYVCYIKSLKNQSWYKMNDKSTSKVKYENDIVTKDASVLLYHKRSGN